MEALKIKENIVNKLNSEDFPEPKPVIKCLLSFVGGLLMMNPYVLGQLSPFSISLTVALSDACALWSAAGGIMGAFLFFDGTQAVKYVAAVMLCILIKGLAAKLLSSEYRVIASYANAFASPFIIGTVIMLATGFDTEEFLGTCCEAVLTCGGAYIFRKAAVTVWTKKEISRCTTFEFSALLISFGVFLMHFYRYQLMHFSPVTLIFAALTLLAARVRNGHGGALCGVCLAFAVGLSGQSGFVCTGLALGGLLSGELVRSTRHTCALGFFVPVAVCAIADGSPDAYMMIFECAVISAVFLVVPEKFFAFLCEKTNTPVPVYVKNESHKEAAEKLENASAAISRVSDCIAAVQRTLTPVPDLKLYSAIRSTWNSVCSECELKESCRREVKIPSDETIERLAAALKNRAVLDETRFPKGFFASCYSFTEMQSRLQNRYLDFSASQGAQGQVAQIRELMSDQFLNTADILKKLSEEFGGELKINLQTADICAAQAQEFGLDVISADSYLDRYGRTLVSLNITPPSKDFDITKLTESLSDAIGTVLDIPELEENDGMGTLCFRQKISREVTIGAFSRSADRESICGDYYRSFRDDSGRYIVILSDGMGTGSRAAVDSAMAAELFSSLVRAGIGFSCALAIVNSALLVKSEEESTATLDVISVDLYTGRAEFMKAGAAATFIRRRGNVVMLEQPSLPMGIIRDIGFASASAALENGDVVLMISDGVLGECSGWIQQELKMWNAEESSPQKLAQMIVESACERKLSKHRDDMTAVAIYIR